MLFGTLYRAGWGYRQSSHSKKSGLRNSQLLSFPDASHKPCPYISPFLQLYKLQNFTASTRCRLTCGLSMSVWRVLSACQYAYQGDLSSCLRAIRIWSLWTGNHDIFYSLFPWTFANNAHYTDILKQFGLSNFFPEDVQKHQYENISSITNY